MDILIFMSLLAGVWLAFFTINLVRHNWNIRAAWRDMFDGSPRDAAADEQARQAVIARYIARMELISKRKQREQNDGR